SCAQGNISETPRATSPRRILSFIAFCMGSLGLEADPARSSGPRRLGGSCSTAPISFGCLLDPASPRPLLAISQIRRWLVLADGHQHAVSAHVIALSTDRDH